jgi:16S rRNA (adenine1518-N6/adenine1519-N6)-dimethyltransferase
VSDTAIPDAVAALPPLRDIISQFGLDADKRLGQHFLFDLNLTGRIARAAGGLDGTIIEIGPGPGGLTRALLREGAERVVAIERDARCVAALSSLVDAAAGRLTLVEGDALEMDLAALGPAPRRIVANLPYNVGTPLLIGWLRQIDNFAGMTLMFQREVAQRLAAAPGSDAYGRLSVLAQLQANVKLLFDVPARAFTPAPKVVSAIVGLTPRAVRPAVPSLELLEEATRAAFGQRRKMLRSSLKALGFPPEELLAMAGLPPTARAEEIDIEGFAALARALGELKRAVSR